MTSKDLMIGDWVLINSTPRKIQAVDGVDDEIMADDELYTIIEDRYHSEDRVDGVPITPEILEKNGFILTEVGDNGIATPRKNINRYEKHECKTKWRDIIMWYDRITKKWCLHGINSIQLNYIHELQHALRLCGIEKEIKL